MTTTRRLAADVAGYSRLMGADEIGTLEALKSHRREVVDPAIIANRGRIVKTTGNVVEFAGHRYSASLIKDQIWKSVRIDFGDAQR